jgi:hemolysin III
VRQVRGIGRKIEREPGNEAQGLTGTAAAGRAEFPEATRVLIKKYLKDPFSGLSHLAGALLSLLGLFVLLDAAWGKPWHLVSFAIYGVTLVLLYTASGLYHLLKLNPRAEGALYGLDRAAIYALIAGTYTPICLVALRGGWGWSLFAAVWGLAVVGIVIDIVSRRRMPDWLTALFYLVMGWMALVAVGPLTRTLPVPALLLLLAGCVIYTAGAVVCVTDKPHPRPGLFHAHDLWHVMVLAGSACHFVLMWRYVAAL